MFEYTFTEGQVKILTPFCRNVSEINNEVISHTPDCIHQISTYPNGFVIESIVYSNKAIYKTNKPLVKNPDGTFSVQL